MTYLTLCVLFLFICPHETGEINHLKQKSESQARDLQKHIKDSAAALTEFEKALVRKSEECNVSTFLFVMWFDLIFSFVEQPQ